MPTIYKQSAPCVKNKVGGYTFTIGLLSQADGNLVQDNPTITEGDFTIVLDGVNGGNLDSLPEAVSGNTRAVQVTLSQAEINADEIVVIAHDAADAEWADLFYIIRTEQEATVSDLTLAQITGSALFAGITSLANWLRGLARKDTMNATAKTELNSGGGTYAEADDSLQGARDHATDPLVSEVPGDYASGTAGAALGRIGRGTISTVAPVAQNGDVTTYQGAVYLAARGTALEWTDRESAWPVLTDAVIKVYIDGGPTLTGEVITATGAGKKIRQELTADDSQAVGIGNPRFQAWAEWAAVEGEGGGEETPEFKFPLVEGKWNSKGKATPAPVEV